MFRLKPQPTADGPGDRDSVIKRISEGLEIDLNNTNDVADKLSSFDFFHYVKAWSLEVPVNQKSYDLIGVESLKWVMEQIRRHRDSSVPGAADLKNSEPSSPSISTELTSEKNPPTSEETAPPSVTPSFVGGE